MIDSRLISLYKISSTIGFLEEKVLFLFEKNNYYKPRDILFLINQKKEKKYAYTTIMTILDKLYKKKFLNRKKQGKTYFYFLVNNIYELKEKSILFLVKDFFKKINFFNLLIVLINFFIINPINNFLQIPFIKGINFSIFIFLTMFLVVSLLYKFYANGFLIFIKIFINEPSFLFKNLFLNFNYFVENFNSLFLLVLLFYFFNKLKVFIFTKKNYEK